jgi:hypothetical protein
MKPIIFTPMRGFLRLLILLLLAEFACVHLVAAETSMASAPPGASEPAYEGRLRSIQVEGEGASLQFANGDILDVPHVPDALVPGDIVRVYKTDQGYMARLWKHSDLAMPSLDENALAPLVQFNIGK